MFLVNREVNFCVVDDALEYLILIGQLCLGNISAFKITH